MRGRRLLRPLFFSLGLSLLGAAPAFAASAADKAAAEALFDQGRKLLSEGKVEDACKKFEGSQRVDPGIGTLLYLADCYERAGRTASAWATFREAASAADAAGQDDRAETGRKRAERLQATLAHLTVTVATELENMEGLTVHYKNQDSGREEALSKALFGSPVPVDPGKYQVTAAAPGYQSFEGTVTITEAANQELAIPALVVDEAVAEPVPVVAPKEESAPAEGSNEGGSALKTTGLVMGSVGILGLGVGTVFGILAIDQNNQAKDAGCTGSGCPNSAGVGLTNDALTSATVSTVAMIAGGVLLAGGATLYFLAPDDSEVAAIGISPTVGGAKLSLGGSF